MDVARMAAMVGRPAGVAMAVQAVPVLSVTAEQVRAARMGLCSAPTAAPGVMVARAGRRATGWAGRGARRPTLPGAAPLTTALVLPRAMRSAWTAGTGSAPPLLRAGARPWAAAAALLGPGLAVPVGR